MLLPMITDGTALRAVRAGEVEFFSIGAIDLTQYNVLAMDHGHPQLGTRLDAMRHAAPRACAPVAGLPSSIALTASLTDVTEPAEFTFMLLGRGPGRRWVWSGWCVARPLGCGS